VAQSALDALGGDRVGRDLSAQLLPAVRHSVGRPPRSNAHAVAGIMRRFGCLRHDLLQVLLSLSGFVACVRIPDEQRLLNKVFRANRYDSSVRPVFNATASVKVNFGLTLIQIMDMVSLSR
jgi:hypothetical protein